MEVCRGSLWTQSIEGSAFWLPLQGVIFCGELRIVVSMSES